MCRLFGMHAGDHEARVTYWLLDASDSILAESHRNPDGTGMGWFGLDGAPHIDKRPEGAFDDSTFTVDARTVRARTLVTHVRAATAGQDAVRNTHPFQIDDLIVAHNGGFGDLPAMDAELGPYLQKVQGDTDSERYAALIAKRSAELGDVGKGITAAATWIADHLPMYSLNCVVIGPQDVWALRYPDQRALHIGRRSSDVHGESDVAHHDVHAEKLVLVASERIDGPDNWRMMDPGELVHIGADLTVTSTIAVDHAPVHLHLLDEADPNIDSE